MASKSGWYQQCTATQLKESKQPRCGKKQLAWPFKVCTLAVGHDGQCCNERQAGDAVVRVWWDA